MMSLNQRCLSTDEILEVLSLSKDATAIYTSEDIIIEFANDAMISFWGKDRNVIGMTFEEAIPELKNQPFLGYLKGVWETGVTFKATDTAAELKVDNKLQIFYFDFEYRAIKDASGKMYCILHTAVEVTDRVLSGRREQSLSEELSATSEELAATNEELVSTNEELASTNEELNTTVEELRESQVQLQAFNDKLEEQVRARTNELATANEELTATNEELIAINEELIQSQTLLQKAYSDLERASDVLSQAIATAHIGTWSVDGLSNEVVYSKEARLIHGIPDDVEVTLAMATGLVVEDHRETMINSIRQAVTSSQAFVEEYQVNPMDGSKPKWVRSTGQAYYDNQGKPINVSGTVLDITEHKEDEQRKNDFIAMASHELKTPLTSLKGYVQLLHNKALEENDSFRLMALGKADIQVNKMAAMINGFLNISRLDSGKITLNKQEFRLDELLKDIIEENKLMSKKHTFTLCLVEPVLINADRDKIGYVLNNLLSNAVKYSPDGKLIEVNYQKTDDQVQVSIKDEGIGVQAGDEEKLFERFYRANHDHTPNVSGFGIGLYISAEIVQRHHGKIGVQSNADKGSTFFFTLPVN